jgi:hypothetical protein
MHKLKLIEKLIDRQTVGQNDRQQTKGGQIDERTDRQANEQMNRRRLEQDRRTDRNILSIISY